MNSKKMRWLILILIAVLALSIGGYLLVDALMKKKEAAEAEEAASLHLFSFDANSIQQLSLNAKEGDFVMQLSADGEWELTETTYTYQFDLNTAYVTTVCSYMSALTAEKKFNVDTGNLEPYGLADPVVLTCTDTAGRQYTLHVGNATATQEYFYVMVPGNDTVFGIAYDTGVLFTGDTAYLKNSYMLNCMDVNVTEFELTRGGETVVDLEQRDNLWHMNAPMENANVNSANVGSMLSNVTRLELDSYLELRSDSTDLSKYGLDDPYYTLRVKTVDDEEIVIHYSSPEFDGTYIYLLYESTGEIASMTKSAASFLAMDISEVLSSKVLEQNMAGVSALDVQVDDIEFRMEMDSANAQYVYNDVDIDALGDDAVTMFEYLYATVSNLTYESMDLDADVDLEKEPAIVFHYTLTDGSETELTLIAIDDTTYWAVVDGSYTGMIVRRRSISGNSGVLTYYEKMNDLLAELQEAQS